MKFSVVIPCFNEEENVKRIVPELFPVLDSLGESFEVLAIDDGSKDGTAEEFRNIKRPEFRAVKHEVNRGLAEAMKTGIREAKGELLIFLDSDFTFDPRLIPGFYRAFQAYPGIDFVTGSPNLGGYGKDIAAYRVIISKLANRLYAFLLGERTTSVNQIFRLYKTPIVKALHLTSRGYEINAEILFKLVFAGKKFVEIPAALTTRRFGVSKLNYPREIRRHALLVLKTIWWRFHRER